MFDERAGLPAHPLFVHAAVVSVPVLALLAVLYVLLPAARTHIEMPLIVLAVAAPLSVAIARESGAALRRGLVRAHTTTPGLLEKIDAHATSSQTLLLLTLALSASRPRPSPFNERAVTTATPHRRQRPALAARLAARRMITLAVAAATCALGAGVLWTVVSTAHAGTSMVWHQP